MRKIFIVALLLAVSTLLSAQQPSLHADANADAEAEIKALELKLAELIVHDDWDEYAKHLASDYVHTRDNGHVEGKDEALASLRDVKRKVIVMEMEPADFAVRIYGDTAVANAEFTIRVRDSGQVKSRIIRLTGVFVKRDGQWSQVAEQETPIGK
ncbi:MAG TPA: nuclear transport factor 2 family protein [Terriglobales bacterium]|nr:nuclear transport factor 2 family protein [Terriglobales bacterium]